MRTTGLIRLTHDPELKTVGVADESRVVCTLRCAMRSSRGRDGGFVDVVAWGRLGELCHEHLTAGSAALVDGQLQQEEWTDSKGHRRQNHQIVADGVQFVGRPAVHDRAVADDDIEF